MKPKIVLINLFFILLFLAGCEDNSPAQKSTKVKHQESVFYEIEKTLVRDTLYILWKKQRFIQGKTSRYNEPFYSDIERGLIFELYHYAFIFEDGSVSDTLKIKDLKAYNFTNLKEMDTIDQCWRDKNKLALKKLSDWYTYNDGSNYNRNRMYVTYILKIDEDKKHFVIYPVRWFSPTEFGCELILGFD